MTYGRQMMLNPSASFVLPQLIDDEYLTTNTIDLDGQQPEGLHPKVAFFVFAIKLSELSVDLILYVVPTGGLNSFTNTLDNNSQLHSKTALETQMYGSIDRIIIEFDIKLNKFENDLPPYLRSGELLIEGDEDEFFARQAFLLRCRYEFLSFQTFSAKVR